MTPITIVLAIGLSPAPVHDDEAVKVAVEALSPRPEEWRVTGSQEVQPGLVAVYFDQVLEGLPVYEAWATVAVRTDLGGLIVRTSTSPTPPVELRTAPGLDAATAQLPRGLTYGPMRPVAFPPFRAWATIGENLQAVPPVRVEYVVGDDPARVLHQKNLVYSDIDGSVAAKVIHGELPDGLAAPVATPLPNLGIGVENNSEKVWTDSRGRFNVAAAGPGRVLLYTGYEGRFVTVDNFSSFGDERQLTELPPDYTNIEFLLNMMADFRGTAQANAYYHTEVLRDVILQMNPTYPGIYRRILAHVNVSGGGCNAFYGGFTISLLSAANGCPNMAYSSVIYHELGHFLVEQGHPTATPAYHEGMADAIAMLVLDSPCVARAFQNNDPQFCLRNGVNSVAWPCNGGAHHCGQALMGAFWNLRNELAAVEPDYLDVARRLWLGSILLRPAGISSQISLDVLVVDDDDGNLRNGTPHLPQIRNAFEPKGLWQDPAPPTQLTP